MSCDGLRVSYDEITSFYLSLLGIMSTWISEEFRETPLLKANGIEPGSLAVKMQVEEHMRIDQSFVAIQEEAEAERHDSLKASDPQFVLLDLFELLEDYGPVWYTLELRTRIVSALVHQQ